MTSRAKRMHRGSPLGELYLRTLREAGAKGLLAPQAGALTGTGHDRDRANDWLARLCREGLAGWWPDPIGRTINRRRYWAVEFRPARCPSPSGEPTAAQMSSRAARKAAAEQPGPGRVAQVQRRADGVLVTTASGWTHDPRFQVPPGVVPHGAGFAAVGMGRDVETGKAWGRSA